MRVYISACGIGLGHATRSAQLARYLRERGHEVHLSSYGQGLDYLEEKRPPEVPLHEGGRPLIWRQREGGEPDTLGTLVRFPAYAPAFFNHVRTEYRNVREVKPDVVVSDSRFSAVLASLMAGVPVVAILNQPRVLLPGLPGRVPGLQKLVDLGSGYFWSLSRAVIVPDFPPPYTIGEDHVRGLPARIASRIEFSGPLVEVPREPSPLIDSNGKNVVLFMISGPEAERKPLEELVDHIIRRGIPNDIFLLVSLGQPGGGDLVAGGEGYRIYRWIEDKWAAMASADLVVSRGGHTSIAESLLLGKPLLLIPVPGHTEKLANSRSVERKGLGRVLSQEILNQGDPARGFFEAVRRILEGPIPDRARKFSRRFSSWRSMARVEAIIEGVADTYSILSES